MYVRVIYYRYIGIYHIDNVSRAEVYPSPNIETMIMGYSSLEFNFG